MLRRRKWADPRNRNTGLRIPTTAPTSTRSKTTNGLSIWEMGSRVSLTPSSPRLSAERAQLTTHYSTRGKSPNNIQSHKKRLQIRKTSRFLRKRKKQSRFSKSKPKLTSMLSNKITSLGTESLTRFPRVSKFSYTTKDLSRSKIILCLRKLERRRTLHL